jgi:hypothetical protein
MWYISVVQYSFFFFVKQQNHGVDRLKLKNYYVFTIHNSQQLNDVNEINDIIKFKVFDFFNFLIF